MKHFFFILSFLSIGLVACTGCTKKGTSTPVCSGDECNQPTVPVVVPTIPDAGFIPITPTEPTETPDFKTLSKNGWELTVSQEWDELTIEDEELQPELVLGNEVEHNLIILVKDPFPGLTPEYVLEALKGFKEAGATVNASKEVELNGEKFVFLDTARQGVRMWFWILVKGGFGYALSCGGPEVETHHESICNNVAKSLKIK